MSSPRTSPDFEFILSQADGRPMYQQIMDQVQQRVAVGDWAPGTKLPSIRELAVGVHVSVITINEEAEGETAIFWADVVPTTHHLQPPYIMAYDIDVARSFESRSKWLADAAEKGWIGLFYHDPDHAFGRVRRQGKRYVFEVVEGAE